MLISVFFNHSLQTSDNNEIVATAEQLEEFE